MIDIGMKIEIAEAAGSTYPVTSWRQLKDCTAMPALIQPSTKIATDYIGDEFTGEILGKRAITGLDFTFAYDGGAPGYQFRVLSDMDDNNEQHWLRITYPDGTKFLILVECEVTLVAPTPSGELTYTLSVTPARNTIGELVIVVYPDEDDPLAQEFTVTNTLTGASNSNSAVKVREGSSYVGTISAEEGYTLTGATVSVTMGGVDITANVWDASTKVISIPAVTAALVITVTAVAL